MAPPTRTQLLWRRRVEAGLHLAAPALDLLLAAGDRLARAVDRDRLDSPPPAARVSHATAQRVGPGPADPAARP